MAKPSLKGTLKNFKLNESTVSTVLGVLVVLAIGVLIFNYFRNVSRPQTEGQPTPETTSTGPSEEGQNIPQGLPTTYKVQQGDDLWKISEKFYHSGYNWVDIASENKISKPNILFVDQELNIPAVNVRQPVQANQNITNAEPITGEEYTVQKGDNLWEISVRAYGDGFQWVKIAQANNLENANIIHSGNVLELPR